MKRNIFYTGLIAATTLLTFASCYDLDEMSRDPYGVEGSENAAVQALNAAIRTLWPSPETRGLRERAAATVRRRMVRRAADDLSAPADDDPLSLHGIKEAARRPLTPVGGGRTLEDDLADVHESSGPPS